MTIKENILNILSYAFSKKEILEISRPEFDRMVYVTNLEEAIERNREEEDKDKELREKNRKVM
jgi:hypothetical protein